MPDSKKPKIVYLFGAGATHAEKQLSCKIKIKKNGLMKDGEPKNGLLARDISERVIGALLKNKKGRQILEKYGITKDSLSNKSEEPEVDIELFISLLEANKTETTDEHAQLFKEYFRRDICQNLTVGKNTIQPNLFPALIEWHSKDKNEDLIGFLTLNYDSVLENSFRLLTKRKFDYGIDIEEKSLRWPHKPGELPFLKLHGSFDWFMSPDMNKMIVAKNGATEAMQWIPPRLNKEYLNYPYNIIHGKAYELLAQCDILRVIGCRLNQNDIGLISLLFKTQHKGMNPYRIDMVDKSDNEKELHKRLGILLTFNEYFYNKDEWKKLGKDPTNNPFLDWLYFKVKNAPTNYLHNSKYLKSIKEWAKL